MPRLTLAATKKVHTKIGVNPAVVSVRELRKGMMVEFEHGRRGGKTNITDDDLVMTALIALAHLQEFPDYYERLEKMEVQAK